MKIGYIRVSRDKQTTILQEDAMEKEQCERVFTDKLTGTRFDRPQFLAMLDMARPGDIIVVWRLDRLGRSLKQLIETVTTLKDRGIELRSIKERIDTTPPHWQTHVSYCGSHGRIRTGYHPGAHPGRTGCSQSKRKIRRQTKSCREDEPEKYSSC